MINGYYTVAEAAEKIGRSASHVRNMVCRGHIEILRINNRLNLIPVKEVERILSNPPKLGRPSKKNKISY